VPALRRGGSETRPYENSQVPANRHLPKRDALHRPIPRRMTRGAVLRCQGNAMPPLATRTRAASPVASTIMRVILRRGCRSCRPPYGVLAASTLILAASKKPDSDVPREVRTVMSAMPTSAAISRYSFDRRGAALVAEELAKHACDPCPGDGRGVDNAYFGINNRLVTTHFTRPWPTPSPKCGAGPRELRYGTGSQEWRLGQRRQPRNEKRIFARALALRLRISLHQA